MQLIKSTRELRKALADGRREFRLCLQGGLYSRKTIGLLAGGRFRVVNHIDGSRQKLTGRQLYTESNIGSGMRKGALISQ